MTYIWAPPVSPWQGWRGLKHAGIWGVSGGLRGWCRGVGIGGDSGKKGRGWTRKACAGIRVHSSFGILAGTSFRLPPFLRSSHAHSHGKRGRDGSGEAPPTAWQRGSCSLCPPLHCASRVCVHSQILTDRGRPEGFELGRRATERLPEIPHDDRHCE